ncbi:MAG: HAMP domain-containing histidine kinase, partial [Anaerolineales bacterium]|nr:HAMP domain-containing histidine kinase [Anaerolineales bacterium]
WIALLDEEHGRFQVACSSKDTDLPAPPAEMLEALPGHDRPWSIPGQAEQPHYLAAPLQRAGQTVGGLVIGDPQAFKPDAAAALGRLAARAVAAIEKARLYQEVQQANESKSQFVALVTHELRIPLTSIKGYTDLIRQGAVGEVNEMQVNFLNVIRNNVERMATLISDLSDISRIERGKLKLEATYLDLGGYVDETINSLQHRLDEKKQTIETNLPADLPQVFADPNRVVQVLTNLVSNAWKYTPEAGQIWVRARQTPSGVRVEVQDTGFGISAADQSKLFTQFFRSESPQVREQTGWGLGLNVTKKLVELMDGEIGFESELGQGSTFWFSLPTSAPPEEA